MRKNYVIYDEPPPLPRNRLYMSMNKAYEMMINRNAYEALGKPEAVHLLYDAPSYSIGIQRAEPSLTNAFRLRAKGTSGNYVVGAKPLCVKYDIRFDCTVQLLETAIEEDRFFGYLKKTRKVVKRKQPNRSAGNRR